jgi:hypothetical protein
MPEITVAATQMACSWDQEENLANAEAQFCDRRPELYGPRLTLDGADRSQDPG